MWQRCHRDSSCLPTPARLPYLLTFAPLWARLLRALFHSTRKHIINRYGSMSNHFESLAPQYVTSWNSYSADPTYKWHNLSYSASIPSLIPAADAHKGPSHSAFSQFSSTCMYFGIELINVSTPSNLQHASIIQFKSTCMHVGIELINVSTPSSNL